MQNNFDEQEGIEDIVPPSSRVKKILVWNDRTLKFEMEQKHIDELRQNHITDERNWNEFQKMYESFPANDHPKHRKPSILVGIALWTGFTIFLILLLYVFFIILQLALFNLIMLVVMMVTWWRACKISNAIIGRILGNGRKKPYKAYIKKIKELEWLKNLQLEVQEQEEGLWIEIHLSEAVDDKDNDDDD